MIEKIEEEEKVDRVFFDNPIICFAVELQTVMHFTICPIYVIS